MDESLETSWRIASIGLADGVDTVDGASVAAAFMRVIEDWVRSRVLVGPASDPSRCHLRPRFGMLRDVHAGFDFVADVIVERELQRQAGNLVDPAFRGLDRQAGLGRIASTWWLTRRAISFLHGEAASGMTGLPEEDRQVASLDAGEDGGLKGSVEASAGTATPDDAFGLLSRLADGRPVLVLDLETVGSKATLATAGLQLWPRLDPEGATHERVRETVETAIAASWETLGAAHREATRTHLNRLEDLRQRRLDHPNMTPKTVNELDRQIVETEAMRLLWPIVGADVARLFGLPSVNAGEQRNTKYRKALASLVPQLGALLAFVRDGGRDG